jgi:ubiquinone/menaquinone biosynthesis C-methylase UbiE
MTNADELEWTGERMVPSIRAVGAIEHLHRYALACEFSKDKVVLDIASGEGYGCNLLARHAREVIGVDISEEVIRHASSKYRRNNLIFKTGDCTSIPLESSCVDLVVSFETLEHIGNQGLFLKEIKRVLKRHGLLIMSTPEKAQFGEPGKETTQFHVKELCFTEFQRLLQRRFATCVFLLQRTVYGTLLVPHNSGIDGYSEYKGSFDGIETGHELDKAVFNIGIASDGAIPNMNLSFFDAAECRERELSDLRAAYARTINNYRNSNTYRIGRLITWPLRKIRAAAACCSRKATDS